MADFLADGQVIRETESGCSMKALDEMGGEVAAVLVVGGGRRDRVVD